MPRVTAIQLGTSSRGRQAGAASLVVVMVLFFVISMVAAYTNRNLIFEQRTSANQYRATRALEAADAGVEWAVALLNTGRITGSCSTSTSTADTTFRQRYLDIDPAGGNITARKRSGGEDLLPSCVYNGANWNCDCPADAAPSLTAPSAAGTYPAFRVRFRTIGSQPGVVHIDVNGCTALSEDCLKFPGEATPGEGRATVHAVVALRNAMMAMPSAALTVRSTVNSTASLGLFNTRAIDGVQNLTVHAGGASSLPAGRLVGPAGTPGANTVFDSDPKIAALATGDRFFHNVFGMSRNTYRDQPGSIVMDCSVVACTAAQLRDKAGLNPGRVFWVIGDLALDSAGDIGTPDAPLVLQVTGNLTFSADAKVHGLVYSHATSAATPGSWTGAGAGSIVGGAMSEGSFAGTATTDIVYDRDVLTRLRTMTGSFVRVPGSWKDFET